MLTPPTRRLDEAARLAEVRRCEPRDAAVDDDLDALTRLAAHVCATPMAAVSLVGAERLRFIARVGIEVRDTARSGTCCAETIGTDDVLEVGDVRLDDRFAPHALVREDPHVVFYAGAPLVSPNGLRIGAICVFDRARRALTVEQRAMLRLLAHQVMRRLDQPHTSTALTPEPHVPTEPGAQPARAAEPVGFSDEQLAMVLHAVDAGYWDWNLVTGEVSVNARFADMFRLDATSRVPIDALFAAVDDPELEALHAAFGDVFSSRTARLAHEFPVRTSGSEPRVVRLRGQVTSWSERGEPQRILGLAVDITADRRRDAQLRAAQKLDVIGGLAAGVAHEINTPLQVVSHNLDFLAAKCGQVTHLLAAAAEPDPAAGAHLLHDEVAAAIAESIDGLDRVTHIVRALKELSHHGRAALDRVDINQMVQSAITLTRHEWKLVATIERDLAPGLPPVPAAAHECGQVLVNLIVNAAHAVFAANRPGQKGVIAVRTRLAAGQVEIRVADTGTGIPVEVRDRIFEPFYTTKDVGRGTGQGLPTARAIVERHGGGIDFETEVGRGTTFIVRLPTANDSTQAA